MADPETRAPDAEPRTARAQGRDGPRAPGAPQETRAFDSGVDAAHRNIDKAADSVRDAAHGAADTASGAVRDLTRSGAEAGRRMAESSRRAIDRGTDLWRQSLNPMAAASLEMNRWFEDMWRNALTSLAAPTLVPFGAPGAGLMPGITGLPPTDVRETPEAYIITLELAGLGPRDVEVAVEGEQLVVRGERQDEQAAGAAGYRLAERRFGQFERRFAIPRDADPEGVQADLNNGLLTLVVRRRAETGPQARRIEVKGAGPEASKPHEPGSARSDKASGGGQTPNATHS
jgi:HSP20 family protein